MKKLILAVAVSMAVVSLPVFAHHPAYDNENMDDETWESINDNLVAADSPHLDLFLDEDGEIIDMEMGSDVSDPAGDGSDGMDQSGDEPGLVQTSESEQSSSGDDNLPEDSGNDYRYQVDQNRPGDVVAESMELTSTTFSAEVSTPTAIDEEGVIKLKKGDKVRIASQLRVDEEDVGQSAQCMVVAQYRNNAAEDAEPSAFMLSEEGWKSWNGSLADLEGVDCQLRARHRIQAHNDELFPGEYRLFFGYQLENEKIVHNPDALEFAVK